MSDGRVFTADYDRSDVMKSVWLPLGAAAVLGLFGLIIGEFIVSIVAAILTFIALRSWPLTRLDVPALRLSADGAEIDGLGLIKWNNVKAVKKGVVQVKALKVPALDLDFRRPLPEVFEPSPVTRLRPWEFRVFKIRQDGKLRLDLSKMEDDPDDVQSAFDHFMSGGVFGPVNDA